MGMKELESSPKFQQLVEKLRPLIGDWPQEYHHLIPWSNRDWARLALRAGVKLDDLRGGWKHEDLAPIIKGYLEGLVDQQTPMRHTVVEPIPDPSDSQELTISDRMLVEWRKNIQLGWEVATWWADKLGCSEAGVKGSDTWRDIMKWRDMNRREHRSV